MPKALPPALACLVGYFGYETIGLVEKLAARAPSASSRVPDMLFARPTLILVFDGLSDALFCDRPAVADGADPSARSSWPASGSTALRKLTAQPHRPPCATRACPRWRVAP